MEHYKIYKMAHPRTHTKRKNSSNTLQADTAPASSPQLRLGKKKKKKILRSKR